jgi:hypothetical protein
MCEMYAISVNTLATIRLKTQMKHCEQTSATYVYNIATYAIFRYTFAIFI